MDKRHITFGRLFILVVAIEITIIIILLVI
jgi:hypothetical protein